MYLALTFAFTIYNLQFTGNNNQGSGNGNGNFSSNNGNDTPFGVNGRDNGQGWENFDWRAVRDQKHNSENEVKKATYP